jgi:hypothetical protein
MEPDKRKFNLVAAGGHPREPKAAKTVPVLVLRLELFFKTRV